MTKKFIGIGFFPLIVFAGLITALMPYVGAIFSLAVLILAGLYLKPRYGFYLAYMMAPFMTFNVLYDSPIRLADERYSMILIPVFLTCFVYTVRKMARPSLKKPRKYGNIHVIIASLLFLFLLWAGISLFWTIDIYHGINKMYSLIIDILLLFVIQIFVRDQESLEKIFKIFVLWGVVLAILFFISNKVELEFFPFTIDLGNELTFYIGFISPGGRPGGFATPQSGSNMLGFIFFIGVAIYPKLKTFTKILLFCFGLFLILNILASVSKGGIGAFMLAVLFFIFLYPHTRKRWISITFLFFLCFIALFILNVRVFESDRLVSSVKQQTISLTSRLDFWEVGFDMLSDRWIGAGIGGFASLVDPWPGAHSFYFEVLFDLGIIGAILFALFIGIVIYRLRNAIIAVEDEDMARYLFCLAASLVLYFIHGVVDLPFDLSYFWCLIGTAIAVITISEKTLRKADYEYTTALESTQTA